MRRLVSFGPFSVFLCRSHIFLTNVAWFVFFRGSPFISFPLPVHLSSRSFLLPLLLCFCRSSFWLRPASTLSAFISYGLIFPCTYSVPGSRFRSSHTSHDAVKAYSSFRWIKHLTHLSVEEFWKMWDFQRKSQKLCHPTDRYKCASNVHALYGSQALYLQCQSVLIFPLDEAIHSLVRCKTPT